MGTPRCLRHTLPLRLDDQQLRHERILVDCRDGAISPRFGPVARGYAASLARRACRLVPQAQKITISSAGKASRTGPST